MTTESDPTGYSPMGIDLVGGQPSTDADELRSPDELRTPGQPAEPDDWAERAWLEAIMAAEARAAARLSAEEMLGRGLLRLRLYLGWSQRDVEHTSGVDQSTISRLETGRAANVGSARICTILRSLQVGDVVFLPRLPAFEPTALELMLRGDPWKRALAEADRRVNRRRSA